MAGVLLLCLLIQKIMWFNLQLRFNPLVVDLTDASEFIKTVRTCNRRLEFVGESFFAAGFCIFSVLKYWGWGQKQYFVGISLVKMGYVTKIKLM